MQFDIGADVMVSRDGPYLQYILLQERPLDRPFPHTRKYLNPQMLPQEAAQIIIDDLKSDPAVMNLTVIENEPVLVDGHDGFKLLFGYRSRDGLMLKTAYYGVIYGSNFYSLRFTAPQRHYFDKDIHTFESILANFHLVVAG